VRGREVGEHRPFLISSVLTEIYTFYRPSRNPPQLWNFKNEAAQLIMMFPKMGMDCLSGDSQGMSPRFVLPEPRQQALARAGSQGTLLLPTSSFANARQVSAAGKHSSSSLTKDGAFDQNELQSFISGGTAPASALARDYASAGDLM
jgi:hypothetical protein